MSIDSATLLYEACEGGQIDTARLLIENGAELNSKDHCVWTPLHAACEGGHVETARLLIENGADINSENGLGTTPLYNAYERGHVEIFHLLIENGAEVNCKDFEGMILLHRACQEGHVKNAILLIENGAEVNYKEFDGTTPLDKACWEGHVEIARLLIENGAEVNCKDLRMTPLHRACQRGHFEIARLLIENGADIHIRGKTGCSPLDYACESCWSSIKIVQMLAHNGADLSLVKEDRIRKDEIRQWIQSVKGFTLLHFACEAGDVEKVRIRLLSDENNNANVLSAREVASTKEVYEIINKACHLWRPDINYVYPTSFQGAADALKNVFSEEPRFQIVASNDALIVELVLGYCDRSWFRPESDCKRPTVRREPKYEDYDFFLDHDYDEYY